MFVVKNVFPYLRKQNVPEVVADKAAWSFKPIHHGHFRISAVWWSQSQFKLAFHDNPSYAQSSSWWVFTCSRINSILYLSANFIVTCSSTVIPPFMSSPMLLFPCCTSGTTHPNILHVQKRKHIIFPLCIRYFLHSPVWLEWRSGYLSLTRVPVTEKSLVGAMSYIII